MIKLDVLNVPMYHSLNATAHLNIELIKFLIEFSIALNAMENRNERFYSGRNKQSSGKHFPLK